jgi:hypothetical protein
MFQDIMTAVTGILILIVILQIIQVTAAPSKETESKAATAAQQTELQKVLKELDEAEAEDATLREKIRESDQENQLNNSPVSTSEMEGEVTRDKQELQGLQNDVIKEKLTEQGRDASVGLSQDEQNLENIEHESKVAQDKVVALQQETKDKQNEVQSLQIRLKNAEELQKRLYLIPDEAQTSKEPVVAVVSKNGIEFSRFNHPTESKAVTDVSNDDAMSQAIDSYSSQDQYFVFYIKPSGVAVFEKLYQIAQQKGFDVGFYAIEEAQQIVLSQPPGSDSDEPTTQLPGGSSQAGAGAPSSSITSLPTASPSDGAAPGAYPGPTGKVSSTDVPNPTSPGQDSQTNSQPSPTPPITPAVAVTATNQPDQSTTPPETVTPGNTSQKQDASSPVPWILIAIAVLIAAILTYFFVRNR